MHVQLGMYNTIAEVKQVKIYRLPKSDMAGSISDYLQQEYGSKPLNTHIGCFYIYIRLGQEICQDPRIQQQAIATLKTITGPTRCVKTKPGWLGLLFLGNHEKTTERAREEDINEKIRLPLRADLRGKHGDDIHIIFSRACLYKEKIQKISTDEIGETLEYMYGRGPVGTHIECFYLFVQGVFDGKNFVKKQINSKDVNVHSGASEELETLPGNWKSVYSVADATTWPATFFSYFPKGLTERERETILNTEVRMPLIEKLEAKLINITPRDGLKIKVQVIITRACKYTQEAMDTS